MASRTPLPPSKLYDLDVTIVSAKHLKNVNWRNGDLKPYVILWVDPDRRLATKPDDSGSTKPVWNERFILPLPFPPRDSLLTLEVFHSKPSDTPKPLVGTLTFEIRDLLVDSDEFSFRLRTLELRRPSGRPHGKIRLKMALIERPGENYHSVPPSSYFYSSTPSPLPPYGGYSPSPYPSPSPPPPPPPPQHQPSNYTYSGYYSSYCSPQPLLPPRAYFERQSGYGGPGPSAPVDYTPYDYHKRSAGKPGFEVGSGLALGSLTGGMAAMAMEEGAKLEEEKTGERMEGDMASTARNNDRYGHY